MPSLGLVGKVRLWLRRRRLIEAGYLSRYFDGLAYRYADPLAIYRALVDHPAGRSGCTDCVLRSPDSNPMERVGDIPTRDSPALTAAKP
ncbi:MAG: hypothetical protein NZ899_11075 [Thermoguttaceae bacterium]|nr:hypothetical protein [Thermoguttaceae bacterium]MDW8079133.1 hypothetical protein [Thermoguttaceae bacterium]